MGASHVALLLLLTTSVVGCTKRPSPPKDLEYLIYYGNSATGDFYVLDADSLKIVDSIPGLMAVYSAVVSPGGEWMFAESGGPPMHPQTHKIDLHSRRAVDSLADNVGSALTLLEDGALLLRGNPTCRRAVISTADFSVVGSLDDSLCAMGGAAVGAKVAVLVGGGSRLRSFDISEGLASGEYLAHLANGAPLTVYEAVVISKGQEVLAIGTSNQSEAWFPLCQ